MENPASFDLNQALSQWRASLQNLGGLGAEELEELEGHLRESISVLHARGLSLHEAFMIATRRLGSEQQLSDEFVKANPQRVWTERAMWMVAGVLAVYTLSAFTMPVTNIVLNCALWSGLHGQAVVALHMLTKWVLWAGAAAIAYWVFSRHSSRLDGIVQASIQRPVLSGLGLFLALVGLQFGTRYAARLAEPLFRFLSGHHETVGQPNGTDFNLSLLWGYLVTQVLWIAAGPLLAGYAWRKRGRPAFESPISYELQPGEDEAARALQSQGLSLNETRFLLARRRCHHEDIVPAVGLASHRSLWLEQAAWMVIGVALNQCLETFVLNVGWLPAILTRPALPLYQHLTGLASACLGLTFAVATIAGAWRWIIRHPSRTASIGRICRRRPLLAAIALVVVCAGTGWSEWGLFKYAAKLMDLPSSGGSGPVVGQWLVYSAAVTQLIIPIALLLWLARRWQSIQANPEPCR